MNKSTITNGDNQLVISYELLALFHWLIAYEEDNLKQLISHALSGGFKKELETIHKLEFHDLEDIKHRIEDFFGLLEALLVETIDDHTMQKAEDINLKTSVEQIDTHEYDTQTVLSSVERATESESNTNPQELLYKELLFRWKPNKKHLLN